MSCECSFIYFDILEVQLSVRERPALAQPNPRYADGPGGAAAVQHWGVVEVQVAGIVCVFCALNYGLNSI